MTNDELVEKMRSAFVAETFRDAHVPRKDRETTAWHAALAIARPIIEREALKKARIAIFKHTTELEGEVGRTIRAAKYEAERIIRALE